MPLISEGQSLSRYDVIGQRVGAHNCFISHCGLYSGDDIATSFGKSYEAVHMRPPLSADRIRVDVGGTVPLSVDERKELSAWFEEIKDEYARESITNHRQYFILPAWCDSVDAETGIRRYRRYSCSGLVVYAYAEIGISLVDCASLPPVDRDTIKAAFPFDMRLFPKFGLEGGGPWKILLPGYVFRALARDSETIRGEPYRPVEGDEA